MVREFGRESGLISFRKFLILWLLVAMIVPTMGYAASGGTPGPNSGLAVHTVVHGNTGDVKISPDGTYEPPAGGSNEPHVVCNYWIQGYRMEASSGTLTVTSWPPNSNSGTVVLTASWTGIPESGGPGGYFFSNGPYSTPAGHYKVEVTNGEHHTKSKVYWVEPCPTATPTSTEVPTSTPTETVTSVPPTETPTATNTATVAPTATSTGTTAPTASSTSVPTSTGTTVPTATPTATTLVVATATNTSTATETNTSVPDTSTPTATNTAVAPTATNTAVPPTATPTTPGANLSGGGAPTPTHTAALAPTSTATPRPTATNTPRPTSTATPRPTSTNTPRPTATNTPRPTNTATPRPTATSTPSPTSTPQVTATSTPRPTSTATPSATSTPRPVRRHPTTGGVTGEVGRFAPVVPASRLYEPLYATFRINGHTFAARAAPYPVVLYQNAFTVDSDYQNLGRAGLTYAYAHDDLIGDAGTVLYTLRPGQVITVQRGSRYFRYVVTSNVTVAPNNVAALTRHYSRSTLVLVTCTPIGVDTSRVVVTAQLR